MSRLNVLGTPIQSCSLGPVTGFTRNGYCMLHPEDHGTHLVCGRVTQDFLKFTFTRGNDLMTTQGSFPGLQEGQYWCFCVFRWIEAYRANPALAPRIRLESTDIEVLRYIPREVLQSYSI
jgi:uncharacterized protein (DUF2237 family)